MNDKIILTRVDEIERALVETLARQRADSEQGCSALFNVLAASFVKLRKDPAVSLAVAEEMRRAAAKLVELAGGDLLDLERILAGARSH